jgi:hypothetical protein
MFNDGHFFPFFAVVVVTMGRFFLSLAHSRSQMRTKSKIGDTTKVIKITEKERKRISKTISWDIWGLDLNWLFAQPFSLEHCWFGLHVNRKWI